MDRSVEKTQMREGWKALKKPNTKGTDTLQATRTSDHQDKNEKDITKAVPSWLQTTRAYSSLGCP